MSRTPRATDSSGLLLGGEIAIGTRIGGYVVERKLPGRGAGHHFEATHVLLPRRALLTVMPAIDELTRPIAHDGLRAACIVDAMDHEGIPRVYECGMLEYRRPWVAMELIAGRTLASVIEGRSVPALEAARIVRDVASILEHAHARGLVHHDISPLTIVMAAPRRFPLCIADWSGARAMDSRRALPRLPSESAPFIAPEQQAGDVIDGRADVYALGMVARRLLQSADAVATPPVFKALVRRMSTSAVAERPTATEVREHAAWLVDQLDPEAAVPELVDDDRSSPTQPMEVVDMIDRTPPAPFHRPLTSDIAPTFSGEIRPRRRS